MRRYRVTAISKEIRRYSTVIEAKSEEEARAIADEESYEDWEEDLDSDPNLMSTEAYIDSVEEIDEDDNG